MKKKWIVIQRLYKKAAAELKEYAEEVVAMVGTAIYFNPPNTTPANPTLAEITTDIGILDTAISATETGKTKTDAVTQAQDKVVNDLDLLGLYVQGIANQPVNKTIGDVIIHAAGMEFKKTGLPKARVFSVLNSPVQKGDVIARTVNGGNRAAYEWQVKKVNEVNWAAGVITLKATFTYHELQSGNNYQFRVKTVNTKGNTNYSNVLELVVL